MYENMKIGGWKTESVAKYYIGATSTVAEKCSVAREHAAKATRARASCHCRLSFKQISLRVHERMDQNDKKV